MGKTIPQRMVDIEEMYPLAHEYESDARSVWPKRWEAMKEIFENMRPIYQTKEENDE